MLMYTIIWMREKKTGKRFEITVAGHASWKEVKKIAKLSGAKATQSQWVTKP